MRYSILILFCLAIISIPNKPVLAYAPLTTHAGLTENIVNFYNFSAPKKITNTQMEWLIQGSQDEDNGLRCLNHAYDPIYNRGWHLSIPNLDIGYTSKEWSQSESAQISFGAMDFSGIKDTWQSLWLGPNNLDSNQTWNRAIYEYLNGHEKEAFVALGHVLHLIEDTTVPAHVRANSHPDILGKYSWSDYEERAKMYDRATLKNYATTLYNQGLTSPKFNTLNNLFDDLAGKVNHYYYSDDTIRSGEYKYPQPEYEGRLPEGYFVMGNDYKGSPLHLAYKQAGVGYRVISGLDVYTLNNDLVFKDYWQSLSPLAISYGSSTIDLFFKEVQKAAQDKDYLAKNNQSTLTKLAANLLNLTIDLNNGQTSTSVSTYPSVGGANIVSNITTTSQTSTTTLKVTTSTTKAKATTTTKKTTPTTVTTKPTTTTTKVRTTTTTKLKTTNCVFNSANYISNKTVILNEIAWMGSAHSPNDEWIELKNLTDQTINIGQWQIVSKTDNINIVLPQNTVLPAHGFYLLERTDDTSAPYTISDLIYVGSLNNTNDGLKLFNSQCLLADQVMADSAWPAGDTNSKRSMERGNDLTWHTYSYADSYNNVFGTPKAENSPAGWKPPSSSGNSSMSSTTTTTIATTTTTTTKVATTTTTLPLCSSNIVKDNPQVIFNEIAWMGSSSQLSDDEWIELKNISNASVDISSWQIFDKTGKIKIAFPDGTILVKDQLLLLERTNDESVPGVSADLIYEGAINNTDETLSLYDTSCKLIDKVVASPDWSAGDKEDFKTMERGDDLTWHTYCGGTGIGSPKGENSSNCPEVTNTTNTTNTTTTTTTTTSTTTTTLPLEEEGNPSSYISNIKWHPFGNGKTSQYIEFKANDYPFIPNLPNQTSDTFSAMALYLNQDVPSNLNLGWSNSTDWQVHQGETNSALILGYYNCGHYPTNRSSLVFPVISNIQSCQQCYGHDCAINCNYIPQDHEFIFEVKGWLDNTGSYGLGNITANDYFTIGFYSYNSTSMSMDLVLADNHKYYFNPNNTFQSPQSIKDFSVQYDDANKQTILKFSPAQDADTPERKLNYFIAYAHTIEDLNQEKYNYAFSKGASELSKDENGQYTYVIPNSEMGDYDMFNGSNYYFTIKAYDPQMLFSSLWVPQETDKIVIPPEPKPPMVLSTYFKDIKFSFTKLTGNDIPRLTLEYELINSGKAPQNLNFSAILAAWDYNPGLEFQVYNETQQKLSQKNLITNESAGWLYAYLSPCYPYVSCESGAINYGGSTLVPGKQRVIIKRIDHSNLNNGQSIINVDGITEADLAKANFTLDNNAYIILAYGATDGNITKWYWFTHSSEPTYFTQN